MRMSRNRFIIHFVISLKADRPYKATVVYKFATVAWQTVVYQLYTTARGFDVAHAKWYIYVCMYVCMYVCVCIYLYVCMYVAICLYVYMTS